MVGMGCRGGGREAELLSCVFRGCCSEGFLAGISGEGECRGQWRRCGGGARFACWGMTEHSDGKIRLLVCWVIGPGINSREHAS
jgi:hypothetical protein